MARAKITSLCIITLLLFLTFSGHGLARRGPTFSDVTPVKIHGPDEEVEKVGVEEDGCGGVAEDECMMRRTLEAHLDYIYTQKQKQP